MRTFLHPAFAILLLLGIPALARTPRPETYSAETTWPGIKMEVTEVTRLGADRLLISVRLEATAKAPASTLIGSAATIPRKATKDQIASGIFTPQAFSLASATMTDDATGKSYPTLPPEAGGQSYRPAVLLMSLSPGQAALMSIQFAAPPPPAANGSDHPPTQTISLTLPNAAKDISKIPVPFPAPAPSPDKKK